MNLDNITQEKLIITREKRESLLQQKAFVIWFTGLSGSGKSTLAKGIEEYLYNKGMKTMVLDGDNTRLGINKDLNFSPKDRSENIRRVAEICRLFNDAGIIILASFISPFLSDRLFAKEIIGADCFIEVFVEASLDVCIKRDPKGLYRKAIDGDIPEFTGISSPYQAPITPDIVINTELQTIKQSIENLWDNLNNRI